MQRASNQLTSEQTQTELGGELPDHLIAKLRVSVPGYELLDKIQSGGQATVYRAKELTSGLTVAIKVLNGGVHADTGARERLIREAAALRALNHPNIVCMIESGRTAIGLDYIVMNYVEGRPLDAIWKDRKFSALIAPEPSARLRLFQRICNIVQSAHLKGITHRDLSPSNILITADGEPHILDFGLASTAFDHLLSPDGRDVTITGQFIGKVKYASPEQARSDRGSIDIRTDVYALGVILYQILTDGAFPYEVVGALVDVLNNIINAQPTTPSNTLLKSRAESSRRLRQKDPRLVNETMEAVVLKALEKNPADRYQSAGEFAADIDQYLAGRPTAAVTRSRAVVSKNLSAIRNHFIVAISSLVFLIGVLMNARTILNLVGLSALAAYLGAGQPLYAGAPPAVHARAAAFAAPAPRARAKLGAAPKPQFQVNNKKFNIDPKDHSVQAVRSMPPRDYEAETRTHSVEGFYHKQFADKAPTREKLANLFVGPYRREFIWWAWHSWRLEDRAWWAWNNYAYFDSALWAQWMQEDDFKRLIAKYDSERHTRMPGFIPQQYATSAPEVIYNDEYIEAVYNPVYTTPSIVVDGSAGARLENLVEGSPRTFGTQSTTIGTLADAANGLQFLSLPAKFDPTYQIEVKRDGILYIFGPKKTALQDGVGEDSPKWKAAPNFVNGSGIQATYQRKVVAGEKLRLHGYEWSIASEQIEVLDPASAEATTTVGLVDAEITQMLKTSSGILQAEPELKAYLGVAQAAEQNMLTPLGNVDQDKVALYYAALDKTQKITLAAAALPGDAQLIASAKETSRQITGLEDSLNEVDELRNPGAVDSQAGPSAGSDMATNPLTGQDRSVVSSTPPAPAVKQTRFTNAVGMTMIPIAPGTFQMGSPSYEPGRARDETLHKVTLTRPFFMASTDVTVGQFTQFETATGHQTPPEKAGFGNVFDPDTKKWVHGDGLSFRTPGYEQTDNFPAVFISFNEARAFCEWLSLKENSHYRLPTEAEWEYACRAGTTTAFNTGDGDAALTAAGWCDQAAHPVAQKQPNAWGLYDMHGTVRQWVSDMFAPYPSTDVIDPTGPASGNRPVTRGGDSWRQPNRCRSAARSGADHSGWSDHSIGFRVVMDVAAPASPALSSDVKTPSQVAPAPSSSTGTLSIVLKRDARSKNDMLQAYVNGNRIGENAPIGGNGITNIPVTLNAGDVLQFRAESRFTYRSLRFAYVAADGSTLFASSAPAAVIRIQSDPLAQMPNTIFSGEPARKGSGDKHQDALWATAKLPENADWILLPDGQTLYDIAITVPAITPVEKQTP